MLDAMHERGNEPVWHHIDARYRPVIKGLAVRLGLGTSDAEEVAQHAMSEFVRAYREGRYDRTKGRLSSWILGIAHHTTLKLMRERKRACAGGGMEHSEQIDEHRLRDYWTDERDRVILMRALAVLRDSSGVDDRTLLAFELTALRDVPSAETARQCGMSVDQVYVARSRVTKKLRQLVHEMTEAFEEDA